MKYLIPASWLPLRDGSSRRGRRRRATASPGRGTARSGRWRWPSPRHRPRPPAHRAYTSGPVVPVRATGSPTLDQRHPDDGGADGDGDELGERVEGDGAPPTSVDPPVPESVMSSQWNIASTRRPPPPPPSPSRTCREATAGSGRRRASSSSAAPTSTRSGDRANQSTSGPWKVAWASTLITRPPRLRGSPPRRRSDRGCRRRRGSRCGRSASRRSARTRSISGFG